MAVGTGAFEGVEAQAIQALFFPKQGEEKMNADIIKEEARLYAIEYMVMNLYAHLHKILNASPETVRRVHAESRERMALETFPGMDAVESDSFSAETQATVERMQDGIEALLGMAKK